MSKKIFGVFCLIILASSLECETQNCEDPNPLQIPEQTQSIDVIEPLDKKIRREFWYFLKNAKLIHQISTNSNDRFLLIFIYENQMGLFLCYATYHKETEKSQIEAFMRIGNSPSQKSKTSPMNDPFLISLHLQSKEYLVERNEDGKFVMRGEEINFMEGGEVSMQTMKMKEKMNQKSVKKAYEYYLEDSTEQHRQSIMSNQKVYMILTYRNKMGRFLAFCSCSNEFSVNISLFMRLGDGDKAENQLKPCILQLN